MADTASISQVTDNIEPTYEEHGWTETDIITRLDAGAIPERVIATYWRMRASAVLYLVNTSESGSSRGNDTVYPRLKALADDWDAKATVIEVPVSSAAQGRLGSFSIKRV